MSISDYFNSMSSGRRSFFGREVTINLTFAVTMAILTVLLIFPIFLLIKASFMSGGPFDSGATFTLANYIETYSQPSTYRLWKNTFLIAAGTTVVSTFLGVSMAWAVARTNVPFRKLLGLVMLIPYPAPAYLIAVSYVFLLGPEIGMLNTILESLFGFTVSIYSYWGIILVSGLSKSTLPFLITIAAFRNIDPAFEAASRLSGAGVFRTLRHITLPLVMPSVTAASLLVFTKSLDDFGVPVFLGLPASPPIYVFATRIWAAISIEVPSNYSLATALSTTLLLLAMIGLLIQRRATAQREKYETITGQGYNADRYDLGKLRWAFFGLGMTVLFLAVILPFSLLLVASLSDPWIGELWFNSPTVHLTLDNYAALMSRSDFTKGVTNSLIIGFVGATVGMLFITVASYMVIKVDDEDSKFVSDGSSYLDQLLFMPAAIPGVVFALGILWVALTLPTFGLYGTIWLIMIGYIGRELPVGSRTIYGSITQIDDVLEEQSYLAGATWFQTIRTIVLPLISKGFVAGWILLFIGMIKKLSIPIFLYTSQSIVFPVIIYKLEVTAQYEQLAAAAVLMMGLVILVVGLGSLLGFDLID